MGKKLGHEKTTRFFYSSLTIKSETDEIVESGGLAQHTTFGSRAKVVVACRFLEFSLFSLSFAAAAAAVLLGKRCARFARPFIQNTKFHILLPVCVLKKADWKI